MAERTQNLAAQALHDRAAASATETRQAILGLSSAALGVFFLALTTGEIEPPLLKVEQHIVLLSLVSMAVAVFASLWAAFADAQWSYWWARYTEKRPADEANISSFAERRDYWHRQKRRSEKTLATAFAIGILLSAIYLVVRIYAEHPDARRPEPNQRTASKAATDLVPVCHPPFGRVARFPGLAVADLVSR